MIGSLLIANRGEIACRIIRTARRMGIRTVAVYSDADAGALHVRQADQAVHIGPSPARESYLVGDRIIAAAKATGAEAIHPGYGFLSENADFAEAVTAAGLIWVGATPHSIRAMGLKDAAKRLMAAAGVPVTPGYLGEDQSPDRLQAEADAIGYPVLIKAVAGGGGKGMRRVEASADFADALASCQREAASSFGDDRVILEKYILSPRHIEVQMFGDTHGNIVHLFERDCSLQRRHQKVIEEAPAPGMDEATREAICAAAFRAAQAVDYVGAGTIEFIADASEGLSADRTWFMEMNTRLQVEHPVTEEITGVDLVEWQIRVASGEKLPKRQEDLSINGHAIEARLYAEDPAKGFLPSVGRLESFDSDYRYVRLDNGYEAGDQVSPHYDPMLAKLIAHGSSREAAIAELQVALENLRILPVSVNAAFLHRALTCERFRSGDVDTGLIEALGTSLTQPAPPDEIDLQRAAWCLINDGRHGLVGDDAPFAFRLNAPAKRRIVLAWNGERHECHLPIECPHSDDHRHAFGYSRDGVYVVNRKGQIDTCRLWQIRGLGAAAATDGAILAPMPGRVTAVEVTTGQSVTRGQRLLTLEAMKMEHALTAPFDGVVAELNASEGGQVSEGTVLVRVERVDSG